MEPESLISSSSSHSETSHSNRTTIGLMRRDQRENGNTFHDRTIATMDLRPFQRRRRHPPPHTNSGSESELRRSLYRLADNFSAEGDWDLATMIALFSNSPTSRATTEPTTTSSSSGLTTMIDPRVEEEEEENENGEHNVRNSETLPRIRRFFFGFGSLRRPTNLAEAYNATRMVVSRDPLRDDDRDIEEDEEISEDSRGPIVSGGDGDEEVAVEYEDEDDEDDGEAEGDEGEDDEDDEDGEEEESRALMMDEDTMGTGQVQRDVVTIDEGEDMDRCEEDAREEGEHVHENTRYSMTVDGVYDSSDSIEKHLTNEESSGCLNSVLPRTMIPLPPPPAFVRDPYANMSIREFYADEAGHNPRLNMALFYLNLAERDVGQDQIAKAVKHYRTSIKYFATAEAHTYLGWMYSRQGSYRRAIKECHKAIACDDTFGNPYNDIGFYLLTMNYIRESISWFERAKRAARATNRIAPYVNLAGVYRRLGMPERALVECHEALRYDPSNRFLQDRRKELIHELGEHRAAIAIIQGSCLDSAGR